MNCDCCKEEVESFALTFGDGTGLCEDFDNVYKTWFLIEELGEAFERAGHRPECELLQLVARLKVLTELEDPGEDFAVDAHSPVTIDHDSDHRSPRRFH
jgi:hypothetical protein